MIYVDFTDCIPQKGIKYHGGGNYGKRYIRLLAGTGCKVTVIVPDQIACSVKSMDFSDIENVEVVELNDFTNFVAEENSVLFIPLLKTRRLRLLRIIKANNPTIKLYLTIHGDRDIDLIPDGMDAFYFSGILRYIYWPYAAAKYVVKRSYAHLLLKRYIPYCDKVFTVSNDSMQKIQRSIQPKRLRLFFEGSVNSDTLIGKEPDLHKENYALFVSGDRPEKNLLRTLLAFQEYKKMDKSGITLKVTGVKEEQKKCLLGCRKLNTSFVENNVEFLEYLDQKSFEMLYRKSKFLLYPSKSEGFGLPLVEACMNAVPVLASSITACPEVLGSAAFYVNPYRVNSIYDGMVTMFQYDYAVLQDMVLRRRENIVLNIQNSDLDFLADFYDL